MTGILLEGVVASGKTSVIRAIEQQTPWRSRGCKLVLSEFYTERANEHLRTRNAESYRVLMEKNLRLLEAAHQIEVTSPQLSPGTGHDMAYMVERFHLTNAISYADEQFDAYEDIDRHLGRLRCGLVLLVVDEMMIGPRLAEVYRERTQAWREYQDRLQSRVGDLGRHYVARQRAYRAGAEWSALESIVVNTTDKNWSRCAEEVLDFWGI